MKINDLSEMIYQGYGIRNEIGIRYFNEYIHELKKWSFPEIVNYQVQNFPQRYVLDFILSTAELWRNLPVEEWVRILSLNNPRPAPKNLFEIEGFYPDIYFLFKYVGVNALEICLQQENISINDKKNLILYCRNELYFLVPDELDLDGEYFVSIAEVVLLRSLLSEKFCSTNQPLSSESLKKYMDAINS